MNLSTYLTEMSGLRGALERGFEDSHNGYQKQRHVQEKRTTDRNIEAPPWITFPDLSHMNPPRHGGKGGRPRK